MPHQSLIPHIQLNVSTALKEDIGGGDLTAHLIPATQTATARIISRQEAVLCGMQWFEECFFSLDPGCEVHWTGQEGAVIQANQQLCEMCASSLRPAWTGFPSAR